jgi:hypothetical protein
MGPPRCSVAPWCSPGRVGGWAGVGNVGGMLGPFLYSTLATCIASNGERGPINTECSVVGAELCADDADCTVSTSYLFAHFSMAACMFCCVVLGVVVRFFFVADDEARRVPTHTDAHTYTCTYVHAPTQLAHIHTHTYIHTYAWTSATCAQLTRRWGLQVHEVADTAKLSDAVGGSRRGINVHPEKGDASAPLLG